MNKNTDEQLLDEKIRNGYVHGKIDTIYIESTYIKSQGKDG